MIPIIELHYPEPAEPFSRFPVFMPHLKVFADSIFLDDHIQAYSISSDLDVLMILIHGILF